MLVHVCASQRDQRSQGSDSAGASQPWCLTNCAWSISQMHGLHHKKASGTGPPTGSSSAGLITGVPVPRALRTVVARAAAAETRGGDAANGPVLKVDRPSRAVAARAVDLRLPD